MQCKQFIALSYYFILFYRLNHRIKISMAIPMNNTYFNKFSQQAQQLGQLIETCQLTRRKLDSALWCRRAVWGWRETSRDLSAPRNTSAMLDSIQGVLYVLNIVLGFRIWCDVRTEQFQYILKKITEHQQWWGNQWYQKHQVTNRGIII